MSEDNGLSVKCSSCKGVKEILSLGFTYRKCDVCDGSGMVPKQDVLVLSSGQISNKIVFPSEAEFKKDIGELPEADLPILDSMKSDIEDSHHEKKGIFSGKKKK